MDMNELRKLSGIPQVDESIDDLLGEAKLDSPDGHKAYQELIRFLDKTAPTLFKDVANDPVKIRNAYRGIKDVRGFDQLFITSGDLDNRKLVVIIYINKANGDVTGGKKGPADFKPDRSHTSGNIFDSTSYKTMLTPKGLAKLPKKSKKDDQQNG